MISLAQVKINGLYDWIFGAAPTAANKAPTYTNGQTWLDTVTGFSYRLIDDVAGTWVQIEQNYDAKINLMKENVFKTVLRYLQNNFVVARNENYFEDYDSQFPDDFTRNQKFNLAYFESIFGMWSFDAGTKKLTIGDDIYGSIVNSIKDDDVIMIYGSRRNDGYYNVTAVDATSIDVDEDLKDDLSNAFVYLVDIPQGLIQIIGNMIWWDVFKKPQVSGMQSERIGTYSYTLANKSNGALNYPDDVVSGIEAFEGIAIGGETFFVD